MRPETVIAKRKKKYGKLKDKTKLPLSRGLFAIVDEKDWDWLTEYTWSSIPRNYLLARDKGHPLVFYAIRSVHMGHNKTKQFYLHRQVFEHYNGLSDHSLDINHKNGNPLDCRLENLELITRSQNLRKGRTARRIEHNGTMQPLYDVVEELGLPVFRVAARWRVGIRDAYSLLSALDLRRGTTGRAKPVKNSIGEVFASMKDAALHYKVAYPSILYAVKNNSNCCKLKWWYA